MRAIGFLVALASCAAFALPAEADDVRGTRSELLVEVQHDVSATLHRGWAELRVRRTVHNGGERHDQALFMIEVPGAAVATSLATLGTLRGRPRWFSGELMEAEAAAEKYRELTGIGGFYPKDPALLSWRHQGLLALQVFPCAPHADKSIEYTLKLPTSYARGAHRLELPGLGTNDRLARITVRPANARDRLLIDDRRVAAGTRVSPALERTLDLALAPAMNEPLGGELAVVPFAAQRVLTRFSIEAAPEVSKVPRGAYVVVAIDASRSVSQNVIEAQQAAAAEYLKQLPDAEVEILTFDRAAHRRYGRFVPSARAARELETRKIEQRNGSAVELALYEAERLLNATPRGRPRRIVLMSDGLTRSKLKPERLESALGTSGAIAHLAIVNAGGLRLERDDRHAWATAPRKTGGLLWQTSLDANGDREEISRKLTEWVRPLRVDRFRLYSPDLALGEQEAPPEVLDEGSGVSYTFIASRPASWIRVEGELWSQPVEHVLHPDTAAAKNWSALVFGTELLHGLSEPEMMVLAFKGGAVSPVTSYLAIEPGVRPSTEGLEHGEVGFGSGRGMAPSLRMGAASVSARIASIDRDAFLRDALKASWRACGGVPDTASVSFETTLAEVVDVTRLEIQKTTDPLLERCLTEAVWDLALTPHFSEEWNTWTVDV